MAKQYILNNLSSLYNRTTRSEMEGVAKTLTEYQPDYTIYLPCEEGKIHLVLLKRGKLYFHNHTMEELKSYIGLDMLRAESFMATELVGCGLLYRFLKYPIEKRDAILKEYGYGRYSYQTDETFQTATKKQFFSWVKQEPISRVLVVKPAQMQSARQRRKELIDSIHVEEPPRFNSIIETIIGMISKVVEYNESKEFRGDYKTAFDSEKLQLAYGKDFSIKDTEVVEKRDPYQYGRRRKPVVNELTTVTLTYDWYNTVYKNKLAVFNNKLITSVLKKHYEGCYTVRMLMNTRGFGVVEKVQRIYIMSRSEVPVVKEDWMHSATWERNKNIPICAGRMEEVK